MQHHRSDKLTHVPSRIVLHEGYVDLWAVSTDDQDCAVAFALLDHDEQARADRFRFRRDRDRFIARRAFARCVLARYLGIAPSKIDIHTAVTGKPQLDPSFGLHFNTSHSSGLAVVVVAGRQVGVDVERWRDINDAMGVASAHLTERETETLRSVPPESRSEAFLTLWTRKESFVKAVGGGLSIPLDSFDMSRVGVDGVGRASGPSGDLPFTFVGLRGLEGYLGAITVAGTQLSVRHMAAEEVAA